MVTLAEKYTVKLKIILHEAEEGGFWAEVPSLPGCTTQGDSIEELLTNLYEAIEAYLSIELSEINLSQDARILEIAV